MKKLSKTDRALQRESELKMTLEYFEEAPPSIKDYEGEENLDIKYRHRCYNRAVEDFVSMCKFLDIGIYEYKEARSNIKRELSNLIYHLEYLSGINDEQLPHFNTKRTTFKDAISILKQAVPYFTTDFDGQVYP